MNLPLVAAVEANCAAKAAATREGLHMVASWGGIGEMHFQKEGRSSDCSFIFDLRRPLVLLRQVARSSFDYYYIEPMQLALASSWFNLSAGE